MTNDSPQIIRDPGEVPLTLHSRLTGPISELSVLRKSLLFGELSMIAYNDPDEVSRAVDAIGFASSQFFDHDGAQGYFFENDDDAVIVCRGTEPHEWNDIKADANAATVIFENAGRVHRGFNREVDDLWPLIQAHMQSIPRQKEHWFTGHSLGGAMATICAGRCFLSDACPNPVELYTYGSPRVGNKRFVNFVKLTHYRWVHNNDIVTRVPPPWMGYRHTGIEMYLDRNGNLRKLDHVAKRADRWRGFLRGLRKLKIDHFTDHSVHQYIEHILRAVRQEEGQT
jgi:triacylglycerol lipase